LQFPQSLLVGSGVTPRDRRIRLALFTLWLIVVGWMLTDHAFWRDEVRAFSLSLAGQNLAEMLRTVHGEGHPALWYLILRGTHEIFPFPQVLPVVAAIIGIAAMAVMAAFAPFRTAVVGVIMFSLYGAVDFLVVARNYGISALVMFGLAAAYGRVRNTLWFGVLLAVLCNTNVPSCFLAAAFLLFRFIEMLTEGKEPVRRDWLTFAANSLLAALGAYLCFSMVYPTFNDGAVSENLSDLGIGNLINAIVDSEEGFSNLAIPQMLLLLCCFGLIRRPGALCASLASFIGLKLFFYFVYFSSYRHEALFVVFVTCMYWMSAKGFGGSWRERPWMDGAQFAGTILFLMLLAVQSVQLFPSIWAQAKGIPFSHSADVAKILRRPEFSRAIVMADPDPLIEPLPYYVDNLLWLTRQQRFGNVTPLTRKGREDLTLSDILSDAEMLHRATGRPIIFLESVGLGRPAVRKKVMYDRTTTITAPDVERFRRSMRLVARLRPSVMAEDYDVYVYPR
jgi:hypothetical protein